MASKKAYTPKKIEKETKKDEKIMVSPSRTWWGKLIVVIIILGMIILPFVSLIISMVQKG